MVWCSEVLSRRTTALFDVYCKPNFQRQDVPETYKKEGQGWLAIYNSEVDTRFKLHFMAEASVDEVL